MSGDARLIDELYRSAEKGCLALAIIAAMSTTATFQESAERITRFTSEILGTGLEGVLSGFDFGDQE